MKMLVRDNKPDEGQPELIEMAAVDARHAVAADPERYSIEAHRPVVPARSLDERVTALEARMAALEPKPAPMPESEPVPDHAPTADDGKDME